jgi:hypothetical protein
MSSEWHFTTIVDFLDHWQSLLAGVIALVTAIIAVLVTIRIERSKARVEERALRRSLAAELRVMFARAYGAHSLFLKLSQQQSPITTRHVKSYAHMPLPVVYPAAAARIGLLGEAAMEVVMFYGVLEVLRAKTDELQNFRTPDDISPAVVVADGFLDACKSALPLLPKLKTDVPLHDKRDAELVQMVRAALSSRGKM